MAARVLEWPMRLMSSRSVAPLCADQVLPVCRRSWRWRSISPGMPASLSARCQRRLKLRRRGMPPAARRTADRQGRVARVPGQVDLDVRPQPTGKRDRPIARLRLGIVVDLGPVLRLCRGLADAELPPKAGALRDRYVRGSVDVAVLIASAGSAGQLSEGVHDRSVAGDAASGR